MNNNQLNNHQIAGKQDGRNPSFYNHDRDVRPEPEPQEPCTLNRADELLKYVSDLDSEVSRTQAILFGSVPESGSADKKRSAPSSLDGKIAEACTRAASLCGFLRTINNQLAG